jgi:transposase InsO family protein
MSSATELDALGGKHYTLSAALPAGPTETRTAELRDNGEAINHKKVARLMKAAQIAGLRLRRKYRTTIADPTAAKAPDLVGRVFTADEPNSKYVGDITYLPVGGGKFCYLATVIDLASRRLTGWAIADHMRTDLVVDALAAAERTRGSLAGAVIHTDHGSQYTSRAFADACRRVGVVQSMSAVGSSADNAAAESWNATMKRERSRAERAGPASAKPTSNSSAGYTATTPSDATAASDTAARSPTSAPSTQHQLR